MVSEVVSSTLTIENSTFRPSFQMQEECTKWVFRVVSLTLALHNLPKSSYLLRVNLIKKEVSTFKVKGR